MLNGNKVINIINIIITPKGSILCGRIETKLFTAINKKQEKETTIPFDN